MSATTEPEVQSALKETTPTSMEAILNVQVQPPALPYLPSSRTRSKTAAIASVGAALIATGLSDTASDAIVILSGEMHGTSRCGTTPRRTRTLSPVEMPTRVGGRRTQRAPQSHEVHKTFEQVDCSSMEARAHTRSRLIPLQWVHKTKRDGTKKARLVMVG